MQIIDPGLMDIIKERLRHDLKGVCPFAMGDVVADDSTAKAMLSDCFGVFNASHPPAAALDAF